MQRYREWYSEKTEKCKGKLLKSENIESFNTKSKEDILFLKIC